MKVVKANSNHIELYKPEHFSQTQDLSVKDSYSS